MAINSTFYLDSADLATATSVYLDINLTLIAPDGFYGDGTISRQQSSGILLAAETCTACFTESALRSEIGEADPDTIDVCLEILDTPVFIVTSVAGEITSLDVACNSDDPLDTFDGGNLYYRLSLDSDPLNSKVCLINSVGVISVYIICA